MYELSKEQKGKHYKLAESTKMARVLQEDTFRRMCIWKVCSWPTKMENDSKKIQKISSVPKKIVNIKQIRF